MAWRVPCCRRTQPTVVLVAYAFGQSIMVVEGRAREFIHLVAAEGQSKGHKQEVDETRHSI